MGDGHVTLKVLVRWPQSGKVKGSPRISMFEGIIFFGGIFESKVRGGAGPTWSRDINSMADIHFETLFFGGGGIL